MAHRSDTSPKADSPPARVPKQLKYETAKFSFFLYIRELEGDRSLKRVLGPTTGTVKQKNQIVRRGKLVGNSGA